MKTHFGGAGLVALALLCGAGCSSSGSHDHDHNHTPEHNHEAGHVHGEDDHSACGAGAGAEAKTKTDNAGAHTDEIVLSADAASRMSVKVTEIQPGDFREVIRATGEILPAPADRALAVAPVAGTVTLGALTPGATVSAGERLATVARGRVTGGDPEGAARIAMENARRELERATPLRADGIISEKEYAALRAAYEAARAAYTPAAASGAVTSPIAGVVTALLVSQGEYVEAGQPVAQIGRSRRLTLRADLPLRHAARAAALTGATFRAAGATRTYELDSLGGARTGADAPQAVGAYMPLYFAFDNPGGEALPGAAVEVALLGARRTGVLTVPQEALTEQMGEMYVYVRLDAEGYERRLVKTGATDGVRTEITHGLHPGEHVVTAGATVLRLAEHAGAMAPAHSHEH